MQIFNPSNSMEDINTRYKRDKKTLEERSKYKDWQKDLKVWNDFICSIVNIEPIIKPSYTGEISNVRPHYYNMTGMISPFDYIKANNLDFFEGNVIKYITRYKEKNGLEDLQKAKTYLEEIIKNYSK